MTPFEQAQENVKNKKLVTPNVNTDQYQSVGANSIDYFGYQLATHKFNLSIMAKGMKFRGIKFSDLKHYYGLKGRSAKDCLEQFEKIMADYKEKFENAKTEE